MNWSLVIPSLVAGLLTFFAPCTLPLVPGYLGFISGVTVHDLTDPRKTTVTRRKIFLNGLLFVAGFTAVFITLGTLAGFVGTALVLYRLWLTRLGGVVVILFGLFMLNVLKLPIFTFLYNEKRFHLGTLVVPGRPASSLLFGATFGLGWTPCVGPILGTILLLASTSATAFQGALLLLVFSLGLALPFLVVAAGIGHAAKNIPKINTYLYPISTIGGIFIIFLGFLLLTNTFGVWIALFYQTTRFIHFDLLLNYL